jgi:TolB-like protein
MSSIVEGYNYDIFISYRQKDNKHDGWVTKFVDNLKGELEATFKEDVSVYFDENPHDRLQETHNVDKSLEGKLKCLIFIPILSQTYCDPNSYAWQYEFLAFLRMTENDRFGHDVMLKSGNVTSRILPVRIHDMESEDIKLFEKTTGSVLRAMDFVFKTTTGVNRPLKAIEDHPNDNLNKTFYSDQINKVSNAIKEIINGLKHKEEIDLKAVSEEQTLQSISVTEVKAWWKKKKKVAVSLVIVFFLIIGFWILYQFVFINSSSEGEIEKSIAVLPFRNDSPDVNEENTSFTNGLMEEILINLQTIKDFRVLGRTSVEQFRNNSTKSIPEIARELRVNYIVEGSVQKYGNTIRLRVQLIKAKDKEAHLWAESYEKDIQDIKDIFSIQSQIAQSISTELKVTINPEVKQLIEKTPTTSLDALYCYQKGKEEFSKFTLKTTNSLDAQAILNNRHALERANRQFNKAIEYDSTFGLAYVGLARIYLTRLTNPDSILILCDKALSYANQLYEAYILRGYYYWAKGNNNKAIDEFNKALAINPNSWEAYYYKERLYQGIWDKRQLNQEGDFVKSGNNFHEAAVINRGSELPDLSYELSRIYRYAEFYEQSKDLALEVLKKDGDSAIYFSHK